jgi:uncharacterized protein YndB with AHSA1/START domain
MGSFVRMSTASRSTFVYVTYIRATPEKVWQALTGPQFMRQYWLGATAESAWTKGAPWKLVKGDGAVAATGEILEIDPPRRMVIRWQNKKPDMKAEGPSRCTMQVAPEPDAVKLTIIHEIDRPESKFISAVASGWPLILSNLKSLLETGEIVMSQSR